MKPPSVWTMTVVSTLALAWACGGNDSGDGVTNGGTAVDETIEVVARDIRFEPDEITVEAGKTVRVVLVNEDVGTAHDLEAEGLEVRRLEGGGHEGGHGDDNVLAVHSEEGEESAIVFVAETPGTYLIYCTVDGHRVAGMVGQIIVV